LTTIDGDDFGVGDSDEKFSIQSISKALTFGLFFWDERIWERVGVEPSGTAFNSLIQLEHEKVYQEIRLSMLERSLDILVSCLKNPKEDFLAFIRLISEVLQLITTWSGTI
jgi:glutaminase